MTRLFCPDIKTPAKVCVRESVTRSHQSLTRKTQVFEKSVSKYTTLTLTVQRQEKVSWQHHEYETHTQPPSPARN
ncbi:hypothetical protein GGR01_000039 [Acetobacter oeni]|nr:hypothetical protein [Acetobacter oeni]